MTQHKDALKCFCLLWNQPERNARSSPSKEVSVFGEIDNAKISLGSRVVALCNCFDMLVALLAISAFPKANLFYTDILDAIFVFLELVHVEDHHVSLELYHTSKSAQYHASRSHAAPALTSISTKLGTGSSSSHPYPLPIAPVALPGLTKNFPSIS
jgi:hypothetical protein